MGLMLRYNLFYKTTGDAVCGALKSFYARRGKPLQLAGPEDKRIDVHGQDNNWVVVALDGGWEWNERREAHLFVSQRLWCPGFLVFVYDGDYWGYEFFANGQVLDHYVQQADDGDAPIGFPGEDCLGNAEVLVQHLPFLKRSEIAPYLVQMHG